MGEAAGGVDVEMEEEAGKEATAVVDAQRVW